MENCIYLGSTICTFDLKDENGYYYEELVLNWKEAAAGRLLKCSECGAPVYLAAGPVKEPYFAHYDLEECDYGSGHESEELKKGKRMLYQLLKRSFPEGDLQARFRLENGSYSTLFCILEDGRSFAVDYRLQNNSLEKFRDRDTYYQGNRIRPIYILGKRQQKDTKQLDWYQNLIQTSMGYLAFLDTDQEKLTLKKSFSYRLGNMRKFAYCIRTYPVRELLLEADGRMICDFSEECDRLEHKLQEEKLQYARRQEQLKRLREERLLQEEQERRRQEAYYLAQREKTEAISGSIPGDGYDSAGNRETELKLHQKEQSGSDGLNPVLLEKCRRMIEEGNGHLVAKKYYDAIMGP